MRLENERLQKDLKKGSFVALTYAILDFHQRTLTLSNAGQPSPILCSATHAEPSFIETDGDRFPLGIVKDSRYQETCVRLQPGDTVVFYSDGVVEAMNEKDELYETERFMASIAEGKALDAEALIEKLLADITRHVDGAEQHDDMILVVVKAI
jgi:sigma-B regulation protein RsbU (phosphoserine phosphatase)